MNLLEIIKLAKSTNKRFRKLSEPNIWYSIGMNGLIWEDRVHEATSLCDVSSILYESYELEQTSKTLEERIVELEAKVLLLEVKQPVTSPVLINSGTYTPKDDFYPASAFDCLYTDGTNK